MTELMERMLLVSLFLLIIFTLFGIPSYALYVGITKGFDYPIIKSQKDNLTINIEENVFEAMCKACEVKCEN